MKQPKPFSTAATAFLVALSSVSSQGWSQPQDSVVGAQFKDCADCPTMIVIPAGSFTMGSPPHEEERDADEEGPQHTVTISRDFAVGKFEVTRGQYAAFVKETSHRGDDGCRYFSGREWKTDPSHSWREPGFAQTGDHPVVCVNWDDAKAYLSWLSVKTGETYRLITEAEWEYAARAGTTTRYHFGDSISSDNANFNRNIGGTVPVGSYAPNAFGLYDMHGNVIEWTEDCWHANYEGAPSGGSAWVDYDCERRMLRGGSWTFGSRGQRSAYRGDIVQESRAYLIGFRAVRTIN